MSISVGAGHREVGERESSKQTAWSKVHLRAPLYDTKTTPHLKPRV